MAAGSRGSGGRTRSTGRKAGGASGARKRAGARGRKRASAGATAARRKRGAAKPTPRATAARRKAVPRRAGRRGFRLAADVRPQHYDLALDVDPRRSDRYRGEVAISISLERARRALELHAADLRVTRARVELGGRTLRGEIVAHPERETLEIRLPERAPAGAITLRLAFRGRLRGDLRGLYAASSGARRYAFTQLEAADARRFFPCFDEPACKARFRLSVTTGRENQVLSNSPVERVEELEGGRRRLCFAPTPPLSTYLLALAVGELEASPPTNLRDVEIRVWHVPGKAALTGFALETARACLQRLEAYFDLPYPYAKLDLVAAPDFEAGAMENAGAVFFRETLLLVDEATVTLAERRRVAEVICHELAHMWYGDLVTMAWWDDLWLNEAFATWMAFAIIDAWKPEWKMWRDFCHFRASALQLDALDNTHPIYTAVRSPDEATQNFDAITYEKGAAVVRMLERYLGAEAFRAGVRTYIRRHREGNAVAADLWRALEEASGEAVAPVARAWIEQPGFPLLRARRSAGGRRLELRQERFRPHDARAGRGAPARLRWPIPWVGRVGDGPGDTRLARRLVGAARERIDLGTPAPRFVYANADEGGFFRPLHDAGELRALAGNLDALSAIERMGLANHQWALVRAGHAHIESFLELAGALGDERDPEVLRTLHAPLAFVTEQLGDELPEAARGELRRWIAARFGASFEALGWEPAAGEDDDTRLRRAALLALLGDLAEHAPVLAAAAVRFERYLGDRNALEPNLADAVVRLAARGGNAARFDRLLAASREARTPQEAFRFQLALAEFREPALIERALALSLGDAIPTQNVAILLARLFANPAARERAWAFFKKRFAQLVRRMPPMLASRPVEATPALRTRAYRRDVAAFFRAHPLPTAARALRQALERFDRNAELRAREAPRLARWLAKTGTAHGA